MRAFPLPARSRFVIILLTTCVPLVVIETILATRATWWNLPFQNIRIWALAAGFVVIPFAVWMGYGHRWAMRALQFLGFCWCLGTLVLAGMSSNFALGVFGLFLIFFWLVLSFWMNHEMSRTFFDPMMQWFEGRPRLIPNLSCEVRFNETRRREGPEGREKFRVGRIDRDGAFLFREEKLNPNEYEKWYPSRRRAELRFRMGDQEVVCVGNPVRILTEGEGVGIRFKDMTPDSQKDLGDFVESLRGLGYV